jgi:hypothetical protein
MARILFLKGCGSLFWESPSSIKIFNVPQYIFQVRKGFINISESFSYKDSLFILAITRKEDFKINSTFRSDFLVYLGLLNGDKSDSSIFSFYQNGYFGNYMLLRTSQPTLYMFKSLKICFACLY